MELNGKRIIVTGCARGMGAATVRAYVAAGANVVAMDLDDDEGESVVRAATERSEGGGTATYRHVDVSDAAEVQEAFSAAVTHLGGLDVLAHPAAIHQASTPTGVTVEQWEAVFRVNVTGTMLTNQRAYRYMKECGGGSIINFGSISGQRPEPSAAAYSATKGAVHSWTRCAAGEWGDDNVRVNAILPAMATPMFWKARESRPEAKREAAYWRNEHPIALGHQYGDPDTDLGPVMVFFASDASRFITGQLIPVDGGQTNVR